MKKSTLAIIGIVLFSFILSIYLYPRVPEQMATHWDARGEVNGYMSKFWGLFFMPLMMAGLALLFLVVPRVDPLKENIEKFRKHYEGFIVLMLLFLLAVHVQMLLWNIGIKISPNSVLPVGIGLLFYYIGILTENAEQNWFVGVRTPWTLSSERVWKRTNRLAGKLFKIAGIAAFFGLFFPDLAVYLIVVPALLVATVTVIYSYLEYRKELKDR
jgi:uncharacterized membrane protein